MDDRKEAAAPTHIMDWPAIFAGAAIAAGATIVFSGFTAALGLGSVSAEPRGGLGTLGAILLAIFAFLTLVGSYALGGYVTARDGEIIAFSFLYNGNDHGNAKAAMDAMGATLANFVR